MANPTIAIFFGILSTCLIHLAKAMQRHGIEIFDQIRKKLKKENNIFSNDVQKKPTIYIVGVIINQTPALWMMFANMSGAPSSYFTSMIGVGLIVLMLYSRKVLKEEIHKIQYFGAFILILGTLFIGLEPIFYQQPPMTDIIPINAWFVIGIFVFIGMILTIIGKKSDNPTFTGIVFGLFAGGCGSIDPTLKGIGQNMGVGQSFIPTTPEGWIMFLLSFLFGTIAFWWTQWGFARKSPASVLVPSFNSIYVVIPLLIMIFSLPGYQITWMAILGTSLVVVGIILNQAFKKH